MSCNCRSISRAAGYFEGTPDLLHALAHAKDPEVAGGRKWRRIRLESASVVLNVEANSGLFKRQTHPDRAWRSMRHRVADGFPRDKQKRTVHRVRKRRRGAGHFQRYRNSFFTAHRSRELGQGAGKPLVERIVA